MLYALCLFAMPYALCLFKKGESMVGWIVFILGLAIVVLAAYQQLGFIYCLPVAVAWYTLLMRAFYMKKKKAS